MADLESVPVVGVLTESLAEYAYAAHNKGFYIFPIRPGEKAATYQWSKAASADAFQIWQWWDATPMANIGIACRQSGLFIIDCDIPKEDWNLKGTPYVGLHDRYEKKRVDGIDVLEEYCEVNGLDFAHLCSTYSVATTRGGIHFYFRWTRERRASQSSIVKGTIDVRTNGGASGGGYVLAAGSRTPAGPYTVLADNPVLECPPALADLVEEKPYVPRARASAADIFMESSGNFGGLERSVRNAVDGNLNNALYWAARAACADGLPEQEACDLLAPVYVECNGKGGESQARQTIRSGYRAQSYKEGIR